MKTLENMFAEVLESALTDAACGREYVEKQARLITAFNHQCNSVHALLVSILEGKKA